MPDSQTYLDEIRDHLVICLDLVQTAKNPLSLRQLEVLGLAAKGYPIKRSADILKVSPRVVKWHRAEARKALRVGSTEEAIYLATKNGWLR